MPLLRLNKVELHYGTHVLLDQVELTLHRGDRIGLLGRNGAGKSSLLKIIAGLLVPDQGERWLRPGARIAWLDQSLPDADQQSVYDVVASGLAEVGELLTEYHHLVSAADTDLDRLEKIQHQLESRDGWRLQQKVDALITQLHLPADSLMKDLSGGWRRRVALGTALIREPDILLLDEPTNHLDIPAIEWLEELLKSFRGALIFVTHDRTFLQKVTNQIIELDRGHLSRWPGNYQDFLRFREQQLAAEEKANDLFDKKLAEEERWIRQGIKARRTRNEGRVRALQALRVQSQQRRERLGRASFQLEDAERSGKMVAELIDVSHAFNHTRVIDHFSTVIMRGDRIGVVGPNGSGKTTLLKILLGELVPQQGQVKLGTNLAISYFDQLRATLEPEKTLIDNVCGGREFIEINGNNRHAIAYLSDFLFSPERARTPVKALSGGEQNRAILAKLFSKPANILVLDEPTNDLDMETLELLEEILLEFSGTILLVSHDRQFMDNVVTSILVLEGNGKINEYVGGYSDWIAKGGRLATPGQETQANNQEPAVIKPESAPAAASPETANKPKSNKKLSYKDQRELDSLPQLIESLEQQQMALQRQVASAGFYNGDHQEVATVLKQLADLQNRLESAYQRWTELE